MAEDFFKKTGQFLKKGTQYISDKFNLEIHDLINAVRKNDTEMVARCIFAGIDPNLQDGIQRRALPIAVDNNNTDIIEILLEGKADPNLVGKDGESAIFKAVSWRNAEYVQLLMEAGANIYKKEPSGNSPIDEAKRKGFAELLNQMEGFKEGKRLEKVEVDKATHEEIKAKADEAQKLREQKEAFETKQKELKEKAAAEAATARVEKTYDVGNKGAGNALIASIQNGDQAAVDMFLEKIEKLDEIDAEFKTTPLLSAIFYKNTKAVIALVDKGANVGKVVLEQHHSPITLAVSMGAHKLVKFILDKNPGEDANLLNDENQLLSPTFLAYKDPKMLHLLLTAGADPYFGGKDGTSPIVKAIEKSSVGTLPVLAIHNVDLNRVTEGKTPIEWAMHFNRRDWVNGLLEEGVVSEAGVAFVKNAASSGEEE
ncbi:MAG: ankyrin repeat domain-containing protein [Saprospiraceae bacterium]